MVGVGAAVMEVLALEMSSFPNGIVVTVGPWTRPRPVMT